MKLRYILRHRSAPQVARGPGKVFEKRKGGEDEELDGNDDEDDDVDEENDDEENDEDDDDGGGDAGLVSSVVVGSNEEATKGQAKNTDGMASAAEAKSFIRSLGRWQAMLNRSASSGTRCDAEEGRQHGGEGDNSTGAGLVSSVAARSKKEATKGQVKK
jgi:hypothetical protein